MPMLKKYAFFKYVPGALIAVLVGVALNLYFNANMPAWALSADALVKLPVAKNSNEFIGQFTLPNFAALGNYQVYVVAVPEAAKLAAPPAHIIVSIFAVTVGKGFTVILTVSVSVQPKNNVPVTTYIVSLKGTTA